MTRISNDMLTHDCFFLSQEKKFPSNQVAMFS